MDARRIGVVVGMTVAAAAAAGCGSGGGGDGGTPGTTKRTLVAPHVFETSGRCVRVAAGDVNGDGVVDLCVQEDDLSSVQVLIADVSVGAEPTSPRAPRHAVDYRSAQHVFVWDSTSDLCLGDVDGDGCPDLVVAGGDANAVAVWRCDPQGREQFRTPIVVPLDCPASRVAVGDVNGDGRADLVCLDETQGRVRVCVQSALRTFTVDASPPDIGACFGLVCCDLDLDGVLDLVTNQPAADRIRVLPLSSPTGVISPRDHASGLPTGRSMAVGDVDGDGWMDVCLLGEGGTSVVCLRQRATQPGSFDPVSSPLAIAIDESGVHVCVPAVQRRGVVSGCDANRWCPTNGQGSVVVGISIDEPGVHFTGLCVSQPGLGLADLDRDGRLDLCARCADGTGDACVVFGATAVAGGFDASERHSQGGTTGPMCAVADLDGDGTADLVGCNPAAHTVNPLYVEPTKTVSNPLYEGKSSFDLSFAVSDMVVEDLDRDGSPDLACATPVGVRICWGVGGNFPSAPVLAGLSTPITAIAAGDVNGDGRPDLVSVGTFTQTLLASPTTRRTFDILSSAAVPSPSCRDIALGDVDGDGETDLVAAFDGETDFAPGLDGGFSAYRTILTGVADPRGVAIADVDCDGRADVCVCGSDDSAVVRQFDASLNFWFSPQSLLLARGVRVAAGDVDGDGRCDVCVSGPNGVVCALQDGRTRGFFLESHALSSEACGGLSIGDLNGDGRLDLAFVETATGLLRCRNGGPRDDSPFSLRLNGLPPGEPVLGCLTFECELDGDGVLDLVVCCPKLGTAESTVRTFSRAPTAP